MWVRFKRVLAASAQIIGTRGGAAGEGLAGGDAETGGGNRVLGGENSAAG